MSEVPDAPPLTLDAVKGWSGWAVDDFGGASVGQVHGLFADAESAEPSWLIVRQGRVRGTLVAVPLHDCAAAAGRVWTAHGRDAIRSAPVVDPTRPLLREHELTICSHYGIEAGLGRAAQVAGRPQTAVTSKPSDS
jgi:hypothetical protein